MEIIRDFVHYHSEESLTLSLGMFDGVHLGHQTIIKKLIELTHQNEQKSAILTFSPHPRLALHPEQNLKLITTVEEKAILFEKLGIDKVFIQNFDEEFRNLTGEEFVRKILVEKLHVQNLIIGYDHVFGKNKSGNYHLLEKLSSELGFNLIQMEAFIMKNATISSTKIRHALFNGNITEANAMLGYAYELEGKVIHGKKIGKKIGYPTANMEVDSQKLIPQKGAYIVEVQIDDSKYKGMLSIGTNPTVSSDNQLSVEVYILDFDADIYGKTIKMLFRDYLHPEIHFENLEQLIQRLDEDKKLTEAYLF